jgi:hypothetical protein
MSDFRYGIQAILCEMDRDVYLNTKKYTVNYQLNFTGKYSTFLIQDALLIGTQILITCLRTFDVLPSMPTTHIRPLSVCLSVTRAT